MEEDPGDCFISLQQYKIKREYFHAIDHPCLKGIHFDIYPESTRLSILRSVGITVTQKEVVQAQIERNNIVAAASTQEIKSLLQ